MIFSAMPNSRIILALLSGLAIGVAFGWSTSWPSLLDSQRPGEKAKEELLYGGQPVGFWIRQLKDRDPTVRQQAMRALGQLGPGEEGALQALAEMLRDKDQGVRFGAALNLGRMGPEAK